MGKQSKRKNKRNSNKHHRPTGLADDPLLDDIPAAAAAAAAATATMATATATTSSAAGAIAARVRHVDPRVRHASLVALSRTLYDAGSLEKRGADDDDDDDDGAEGGGRRGNKGKTDAGDPTLLRALSERVLDVDVPCATVAVGCLSNYVNFCHSCGDREGGGREGRTWRPRCSCLY